jgi:hypothetical protein
MHHKIKYIKRSDVLLGHIQNHFGRFIRTWHSAGGELVGCWLGRNGKVYAVGHNYRGELIVYRAALQSWK